MNIYIWERLLTVTANYHPEAGVVIIAPSIEVAHELFRAANYLHDSPDLYTTPPDRIIPCYRVDEEQAVFIFPDAGCC